MGQQTRGSVNTEKAVVTTANHRAAIRAVAAQLVAAHAQKVGVTNISDDVIRHAIGIANRLEEAIA